MIVAVTGAAGYVGRFVVAELLARGFDVRAWARPATDRSGFAGPVAWIEGGLDRPQSMGELVEGAGALVHCAYQHVPGRYRGGEGADLRGFLERNLAGSLELMLAAKEAGVERCVLLSTRAVYAARVAGRPLDETHPAWPDTHYGAHKAALEAFVSSLGRGEGWGVTALRPTGVYGLTHPVTRSKWFELVGRMLTGERVEPGLNATEVHGADVARAVALLLEAPGIAGRVFNLSDLVVSPRLIAETIRAQAGVDVPLPDAPAAPAANVMDCAGLRELGFEAAGRPLFEETVARLVAAHRR